ncbi:MAG TPA: glycoside hydrolase family 3 N-terminal domain-containing protein [Candidatus Polarisedimenticolia bacterium]|nr:glycoside hydrolase family 3 N-terminal domain-containing protein [Candidatus Polarisedimenticolia bacterium]
MEARLNRALSDAEAAGQFLAVGIEGTRLSDDLRRGLSRVSPGAIILFARNLVDASQVAAFCRDLSRTVSIPPFLAIDQEGGRVNRLKGIFPSLPPNLTLGHGPAAMDLVREHARRTGQGLKSLGFNLNFAPVLDLSTAASPNGIGDRAYGSDPDHVALLGRAFLAAQAEEGVLGCGKHFPGLGSGRVDSHEELPTIGSGADELWNRDLLPYRLLKDLCPLVMVGHAFYPALQGKPALPATLSREVIHDLLRGRIQYEGLSLTDDLEMGAVDQRRPPGEVTLAALEAGNDLMMFCKDWGRVEEAHATLQRAFRTGRYASSRINASLNRVFALKQRLAYPDTLPPFDPDSFGEVCLALAQLERQVA